MDVDELRELVDEMTAALMIANPNICGVYERHIEEISQILHEAGAFLYIDGANMNANMGRMRASASDDPLPICACSSTAALWLSVQDKL